MRALFMLTAIFNGAVVGILAAAWIGSPHSMLVPALLFANLACVGVNLISGARTA